MGLIVLIAIVVGLTYVLAKAYKSKISTLNPGSVAKVESAPAPVAEVKPAKKKPTVKKATTRPAKATSKVTPKKTKKTSK